MIIKRNKLEQAGRSGTSSQWTEGEANDQEIWDQLTVEAGLAQDRRGGNRRRAYRRVEDKHLISSAHEEAQLIRMQAQEEGFAAGLRESQKEIEEIQALLTELLNTRETALLSVADQIAELAIKTAEQIIRTEVSCDETLVMSLVRDTIERAGRQVKNIVIKVHPQDVNTVKQSLKQESIPNLNAEITVVGEPSVDPGSCIIETNSGLIDASFSTQLATLRRIFGLRPEETANG